MTITVSTDGSALGNPNGPMGWAWADHEPHAEGGSGHAHPGDCDAGGATNGTNQIGELCAVLEALRAHPGEEPLVIETDSQYAINCSTKWVHGWKRNGWVNSQKKPVKNAPLIKAIDAELGRRAGSVRFVWVKGHAGNAGNEKVDELARTYASDCRGGMRDGYLPLEGWQSLLTSEYADGLDIPTDARMLMDGTIDAADYHLGRGEATDDMAGDVEATTVLARTSSETVPLPRTSSASSKASLAERLAEPEGVPDYDFAVPEPDSGDVAATVAMRRSGSWPSGDVESAVTETIPPMRQASSAPAPQSASEENADGKEAEPDHPADVTDHPDARIESGTPRRRPGLGVSGTLRFDPPPSSSPTYDGHPRLIRGVIVVEGYVQGDGTLVLDDAEFRVSRA